YAGLASKQVGDLRLSYQSYADGYGAISASLRAQGVRRIAPYAGGISVAGKDSDYADSDMVTPVFRVGQFDNPGTDEDT
ncbi:MAG: hypothetical protein ABIJ75_06010, partial [Actinomycetota bacterium]